MQNQNESLYRKSFNKSLNKVRYLFDAKADPLNSLGRHPLEGDNKFNKDNISVQKNDTIQPIENSMEFKRVNKHPNLQNTIKNKPISSEHRPHITKFGGECNSPLKNSFLLGELHSPNKNNSWKDIKKEVRDSDYRDNMRINHKKSTQVLYGGFDDNNDYSNHNDYSISTHSSGRNYRGSSRTTASTLSPEMLNLLEANIHGGNEQPNVNLTKKTAIIHSEWFKPEQYRDIFEKNGWQIINADELETSGKIPYLIYEDGLYQYEKNTIKSKCLIKNQFTAACKSHLVNKEKLYTTVAGKPELQDIMMKQYSGSQLAPNSYKKLFAESPVWIVKPVGKGFYKGRGISVVTSESELKQAISVVKKLGAKSFVVAKYILDPMLYVAHGESTGRKFHIRVHVMVGSDGVYLTLTSMTRGVLALEPYKKADFANKNIHDTHFTTRQNAVYDMDALLGAHKDRVLKRIDVVIRAAFADFSPEMYPESKYAFETFGFDFMVLASGEVKLIEINDKSGIAFDPEPFFGAIIETCDRLLSGEMRGSSGENNSGVLGGINSSANNCLEQIPAKLRAYVKMSPDNPESEEVMIALRNLNTLPEFAAHQLEFSRVDTWDDADFIFRGRSTNLDDKLFRRLSEAKFGLINHFTSVDFLRNKANLAKFLQENDIADLAPLTIQWQRSEHKKAIDDLEKNSPEGDQTFWIVKPVELSENQLSYGGQGIQLLTLGEIKNTTKWMGNMKLAVIQEYIKNPLLYKGYKFDLRVYVLVLPVLNTRDIQAFFFWGGYARITSRKYEPDSTDEQVILTNFSVQKPFLEVQNQNQNDTEDKKTVDDIAKDIFELDLDHNAVLTDVCSAVTKLFKKANVNPHGYSSSFQIFGVDVILNEHKKPFILEINSTPALYYLNESQGHKTVISAALNRGIEYAFKNRVGCPVPNFCREKYEYTKMF